jgi:MFS family permease
VALEGGGHGDGYGHPVTRQWRLDLGAVFIYLALGAMFSATPRFVTEELGGTRAVAGFSVSIFFLAAVLARPVAGRLIDRVGRRPFLVGPPFVMAGVMLCFHGARWVPVVLALRVVQGAAGSAFYVAAVTASTDLAPPERRASAVARLSIAIYVGFACGPALGELLMDRGTATAWTALALVMVVGAAIAATMTETRPPAPAPASGATAGDARQPLLHREAVLPGIVLLALGVGYTSITAHSALYARSIGLGSSGVLYATFAISVLAVRLGSGRLADAVGPVRVIFPGIASLSLGLFVLSLLDRPATAVTGVALVGAGWALVFPAVVAWMSAIVPESQRGSALGSLVAFMDVGQGVGGYAVGAVADAAGFGWAYALPGALAALSAAPMTLAIRQHPGAARAPAVPTALPEAASAAEV